MGRWDGGVWRWNLLWRWRRRLFVWEEELVEELLMVVNLIVLKENTSDVRVWSEDNHTLFSVSNFVLHVNKQTEKGQTTNEPGRLASKNLAPPRVQLHVGLVLLGRLNTKERLFRLGTPRIEDNLRTFCKVEFVKGLE
ncbi:uncharacterized protein LOC125206637 [Salvia hispanica]|uniref:uncharacterized protein LOC125206637 n=1 Tax=Salvia hispanica TaxID=49212 RepID=UPI002009AF41|nr:uncharacterized protein LOC125206637 [Salvia hispanica]